MRRREFIKIIGGAAVAWPVAAQAQKALPTIGFLNSASADPYAHRLRGFHRGLKEMGFVEGENLALEYRWARIGPTGSPRWQPIWCSDVYL